MSTIRPRYYQVIQHVARFKQLTPSQIYELLFSSLASRTPTYRTLRSLVASGLLLKLPDPLYTGESGNKGSAVYQLGPAAWHLFREGRFRAARAIDNHALAVANTYLSLLRLDRGGQLRIISYEVEALIKVGGQDLRPDLYVVFTLADGRTKTVFIEVDRDREGDTQIKTKLQRYYDAYRNSSGTDYEEWPLTIWVGLDEFRAAGLSYIIHQGKHEDARALFRVTTLEQLPSLFG